MILIDAPVVESRGRLWAHLVSDTSLAELHEFAERLGYDRRAFDRDHYDVPAEYHQLMLDAGATLVSSRELVAALRAAGLRRPKSQSTAG